MYKLLASVTWQKKSVSVLRLVVKLTYFIPAKSKEFLLKLEHLKQKSGAKRLASSFLFHFTGRLEFLSSESQFEAFTGIHVFDLVSFFHLTKSVVISSSLSSKSIGYVWFQSRCQKVVVGEIINNDEVGKKL